MTQGAAHARLVTLLLGIVVVLLALATPPANAADRIYWTSFDDGKVHWANLDGSGGVQELNAIGATISPMGYGMGGAIDPVQQRYYWANQIDGKINWANLDGSGGGDLPTGTATLSGPDGVSVDPVGRRVYWSNANSISYANLDGSGGADLATGSASVDNPHGTAVYPALGRVYWTNWGFLTGSLAFARTDGSGGETLSIGGATVDTPFGATIDAARQRLYWINDNPGIVSVSNLDGSNAGDIDNRGLSMKGPYGMALDPDAGLAYAANFAGNDLTFLRVDGSGGATVPVTLPKESGPNFPLLYLEPRATSAPTIGSSGPLTPKARKRVKKGARPPLPKLLGSRLTCQSGGWAPDLVEARLYRAPVSVAFSWTRDGSAIDGAGGDVLPAAQVGNYRCRSTATNTAGTTSQSTGSIAVFSTGRTKLNVAKGTARLSVLLPAEKGELKLGGKGLRAVSKNASGKAVAVVRPKGAKKAKLIAKGELETVVKLTYTPPDGPAATLRRRLTLKQG